MTNTCRSTAARFSSFAANASNAALLFEPVRLAFRTKR
jgi:hypothetical protein